MADRSIPKKAKLAVSFRGESIAGFPLIETFCFLTSSAADKIGNVSGVGCHADGSITVTWPNNATPQTMTFSAGDIFMFVPISSFTADNSDTVTAVVSSGTFSFM